MYTYIYLFIYIKTYIVRNRDSEQMEVFQKKPDSRKYCITPAAKTKYFRIYYICSELNFAKELIL